MKKFKIKKIKMFPKLIKKIEIFANQPETNFENFQNKENWYTV